MPDFEVQWKAEGSLAIEAEDQRAAIKKVEDHPGLIADSHDFEIVALAAHCISQESSP